MQQALTELVDATRAGSPVTDALIDEAAARVAEMSSAEVFIAGSRLVFAAERLEARGVPILRALIENDATPFEVQERAMNAVLSRDRAVAVDIAIGNAHRLSPPMMAIVLAAGVDPAEIYDIVAERWVRDPPFRAWIVERHLVADERFVDVALRIFHTAPVDACRLLRMNGSARATEELWSIAENATEIDDVTVEALRAVQDDERVVPILARLISTAELTSFRDQKWLDVLEPFVRRHDAVFAEFARGDARVADALRAFRARRAFVIG